MIDRNADILWKCWYIIAMMIYIGMLIMYFSTYFWYMLFYILLVCLSGAWYYYGLGGVPVPIEVLTFYGNANKL